MLRVARRLLRLIGVGSCFALFWGGGALMGRLFLPWVGRSESDPKVAMRARQRVVRHGFLGFLGFMQKLGFFSFRGLESRAWEGEAQVVIANHPTLIDVVALIARYECLCAVVKGEVYHGPFVGPLMRYCGHLDGSLPPSELLDAVVGRLREGMRVLWFPESTRSPPGGMRPFRRGAFEVAARAGVPLLPVKILCTPPALSKRTPWHQFPSQQVEFELLELEERAIALNRSEVRRAVRDMQDHFESELFDRKAPTEGSRCTG